MSRSKITAGEAIRGRERVRDAKQIWREEKMDRPRLEYGGKGGSEINKEVGRNKKKVNGKTRKGRKGLNKRMKDVNGIRNQKA